MSSPFLLVLFVAILALLLSQSSVADPQTREIVVVIPREEPRGSGCLPAFLFLVLIVILANLLAL